MGLKLRNFYLGNLIFDLLSTVSITVLTFFILQLEFNQDHLIFGISYYFSSITLVYLLCQFLTKSNRAFILVPSFLFMQGFIVPKIVRFFAWAKYGCTAFKVTETLFMGFPMVSFWNGLYKLCEETYPLAQKVYETANN